MYTPVNVYIHIYTHTLTLFYPRQPQPLVPQIRKFSCPRAILRPVTLSSQPSLNSLRYRSGLRRSCWRRSKGIAGTCSVSLVKWAARDIASRETATYRLCTRAVECFWRSATLSCTPPSTQRVSRQIWLGFPAQWRENISL